MLLLLKYPLYIALNKKYDTYCTNCIDHMVVKLKDINGLSCGD